MVKEKLTYKKWSDLDFLQQCIARRKMLKGQKPYGCKYGYNDKGELRQILDFDALSDIFSV